MLLSEGALWQGKDRSAACVPCTERCGGSDRRAVMTKLSRVKMTQEPVGVTVTGCSALQCSPSSLTSLHHQNDLICKHMG